MHAVNLLVRLRIMMANEDVESWVIRLAFPYRNDQLLDYHKSLVMSRATIRRIRKGCTCVRVAMDMVKNQTKGSLVSLLFSQCIIDRFSPFA